MIKSKKRKAYSLERKKADRRFVSDFLVWGKQTGFFFLFFFFPVKADLEHERKKKSDLDCVAPWKRERLLTPVFWPGEFHGLYTPWGRKESDITE